ncbi:MAG: hypothetical protein RIS70_3155 [Planctomycetota bacterium]
MSRYVKNLVADEIRKRLQGVQDALVVNVIGLPTDKTYQLRKRLRDKNISLLVVKSSLARRATEGTSLAPAFEGSDGSMAVCWGSTDFVQLAKEITEIQGDTQFEKLELRGGVMDQEKLTPDRVKDISKWPSRAEQLSLLLGQILAPGANLLSQLASPGGALASQIKQKGEGEESSS